MSASRQCYTHRAEYGQRIAGGRSTQRAMPGATMSTVRESLFLITTADGSEFAFAVLQGDQCAIVRDGSVIETFLSDDASLGRALKRYFKLIEVHGGSRHPFEALELTSGHPHAG